MTFEELRDQPVFICGHPKSGTSLLRAVLDSHPQLVVYPEETIFFRRFLPAAESLSLQEQLDLADRYLIHIFTWQRENPPPSQTGFPDRDYSSIPYERVRQVMREFVQENYRHPGDILSAAMLAYGQVSGQMGSQTSRWVEKSPYNEFFAGQIFAWWQGARCVHVVRDPRDNYASYRLKHPSWSAEFFAKNWVRSTLAGIQNQKLFGSDRYHILRYEDLVKSPETCLRRLTEFLQIDWQPSLISPTRAGEPWLGNSMFANQFDDISTTPIGRWRENLTTQDAIVIECIAKSLLKDGGYESVASLSASMADKVRARWRVMTWPIRRIWRAPKMVSIL